MEKITFKKKVAYKGAGGFCTSVGVDCYVRDTMGYTPSPESPKVIAITPLSKRGPGACEIEIPVSQAEEFVRLLLSTSGIDLIDFAKDILINSGYIDDFTSMAAIKMEIAAQGHDLSEEEIGQVAEYYASDSLDTDRLRSAIEVVIEEREMEDKEEGDLIGQITNKYPPHG